MISIVLYLTNTPVIAVDHITIKVTLIQQTTKTPGMGLKNDLMLFLFVFAAAVSATSTDTSSPNAVILLLFVYVFATC